MLKTSILSLVLAALAVAKPVPAEAPAPIQRRHHETTTTTVITWAPAVTVTRNPNDPTITRPGPFTSTVGPGKFTSTITQACVTYEFILPPAGHPPDVVTWTHEARSTITVFNAAVRTTTRTVETTRTITVTTYDGTVVQRICPNTLVVNYADHPEATWTWSQWSQGVSFVTGLCVTSSTRSTTIPGVTLPTGTAAQTPLDWEWFSGTTTRFTKQSVAVVYEAFITYPGRSTSTVCGPLNPSPTTTTTIVITRQPSTTTTYTAHPNECTRNAKRQVAPPVEVHTVVYTTVTVINNTLYTLTGTAVVDVNTQSFPRTRIAYTTTTGTGVETRTSWVCSLPTP